ncbi:MAG: hypothetical protein PVH61_06295 [Candidatus Aminicenantes bacterium]
MRDKIYMQYNPWWEEEYRHEGIIPRTSVLEQIDKWMSTSRKGISRNISKAGDCPAMYSNRNGNICKQ